jgi:hypothetical protein
LEKRFSVTALINAEQAVMRAVTEKRFSKGTLVCKAMV